MAPDSRRPWRTVAITAWVAVLAFATAAGVANATQYPPAPKGDDIAFVQLGAVGEFVSLEFLRSAASSPALEGRERKLLDRLADQKEKAWAKLDGLLGEEASTEGVFTAKFPPSVLRSRGETVALAARFERLLSGLYLAGVESTVDPPTRLLIGRQLAASQRNLTLIRELRGSQPNLRPAKPLSVEYVGIQFDDYLSVPGA